MTAFVRVQEIEPGKSRVYIRIGGGKEHSVVMRSPTREGIRRSIGLDGVSVVWQA